MLASATLTIVLSRNVRKSDRADGGERETPGAAGCRRATGQTITPASGRVSRRSAPSRADSAAWLAPAAVAATATTSVWPRSAAVGV